MTTLHFVPSERLNSRHSTATLADNTNFKFQKVV